MRAQLPPTIGARYRPIRLIGEGGMGAVYEVEHAHTGERLALKVLHARVAAEGAALERFKREARASARIKSEHVVRVTDADVAPELDGAPFLVMELLEGDDLDHHARETPQPPEEVVEWLRQIARGLDKAHAMGIVHRDLKPANLFLSERDDGTPLVKILDFGIAKMTEHAGLKTGSGEILGTPRFMAPEQVRGEAATVTPATDRFALGLIAFSLLVGRDYFDADTLVKLVAQLIYEPVARASARGAKFGPAFDDWFAQACAREPEARFASSFEQIEALAEALGFPRRIDGGSGDRRRTPPAERLSSTLESAPTLQAAAAASERSGSTGLPSRSGRSIAIAVGLALAAIGVTYALTRGPSPRENAAAATRAPVGGTVTASTAPSDRASIDASARPATGAPVESASTAPTASASATQAAATTGAARPPTTSAPSASAKPSASRPSVDPLGDQK